MANIKEIKTILGSYRFPLSNEKILQREIAEVLTKNNIVFQKEASLQGSGIIDFLIGDIGIEIKIKGNALSIYKQLERYCEREEIKEIILVTNRTMGLPNKINGKPAHIISIGKAWI